MKATRWTAVVCGWLGLFLVLPGCGGGDKGSVSGKVTYKGQAVTGGSLTFIPAGTGNPGKPATGEVKSDGTYVLGTNSASDGAAIGTHKVVYSAPVLEAKRELKPGEGPPRSPFHGLTPKTVQVEVKAGSNTIDIELVGRK